MLVPNYSQAGNRLAQLDVTLEDFRISLDRAAVDVLGCTDFDAPGMRGFMFWSRANRVSRRSAITTPVAPHTPRQYLADDPSGRHPCHHGHQCRRWRRRP